MATARLQSIAEQEDLEAWWYPVWLNQLTVYTDPNYAGGGAGRTAQLSIGPQASLKNPFDITERPYVYPDFIVFETVQDGGPATKRLHLVMEVKKDDNQGVMAEAQNKAEFYMVYAVAALNDPNPNNVMFAVATAGEDWTWREARNGGGGWDWTGAWSGTSDTTVDFINQFQL